MINNIDEVNEDFQIEEIKYHKNYQLIILLLQNGHCSFQSFNDEQNNSLLHQMIIYGSQDEVIIIAKNYKQYINTTNNLGQTPIMLASFLGYIKIVRIMILCGANIQTTDKNGFTPLLYSLKGNHTYMAIYLMGKGADVLCVDKNGCNVVHWSAHNNNIYLLKIFIKHLGLKYNEKDIKGLTPLQRAINNYSYESAAFLSQFVSIEKSAIISIKSKYLVNVLSKKQKQLRFQKYINFILIILLNIYICIYFKQMEDQLILEHLQKMIIICQICYFYLQPQAQKAQDYLFRLNQNKQTNDLIGNEEEDEETNICLEIDGSEVPLIQNYIPTNISKFQSIFNCSFLNYINYSLEKDQNVGLHQDQLCFDCLIIKQQRTQHCNICQKCHPYFSLHSQLYQKCISLGWSYFFYCCMLLIQLLSISIYIIIKVQKSNCKSEYWIIQIFETIYLDKLIFNNIIYCIIFICWMNQLLYYILILYSILSNQSIFEIFNKEKCHYLYQNVIINQHIIRQLK